MYYFYDYIWETFNHYPMLDNLNFNRKYLEMESPENIRRELISDFEFKKWLNTFGVEDLLIQLSNFENAEIYEDCIIINKILQRIINTITVTHFDEL